MRKILILTLCILAFLLGKCASKNEGNGAGLAILLLAGSSDSDSDDDSITTEEFYNSNEAKADAVLERYADIAFENYKMINEQYPAFKGVIQDFVKNPAADGRTFEPAQNAWVQIRARYLLVEALRFADNPIDSADFKCDGEECEGLINAWPLEESTIDAFINNNTDTVAKINNMTYGVILAQNGQEGADDDAKETDVKVGWHAIEYLLWGKDDSNNTVSILNPGQRLPSDFAALDTNFQATAGDLTKKARSKYLYEVTIGLERHLKKLQDAWDKSKSDSWRNTQFNNTKENKIKHLKSIYKGFGTLITGEIGTERIKPDSSQEDEHSCFSDNTKADFYYDLQGILNLWEGSYSLGSTTTNQPVSVTAALKTPKDGLKTLIELKNKDLAKEIVDLVTAQRDKFCLDIYASDPNYKTNANCPAGSISSRYDQLLDKGNKAITDKLKTDRTTLQNVQKTLITDLKTKITNAGKEIGVTFGPTDFEVP